MSTKKAIKILEKKRQVLLTSLLGVSRILRGSYVTVSTKCGRDNCWCNREKGGHAHSRISWSEKGQTFTRKVPKEDVVWIREVTKNYKEVRRMRRKLVELEIQSKRLLDALEVEWIEKTRKGKSYLEPKLVREKPVSNAKTAKSRKSRMK